MCGKLTKRTNEKDTYSFLCFAQCVWENAVLVELQKAGSYIRYNKILHTSKINKQSNVQYINKRTDCKHQYKLKICKHETIKLIDIWTNKVAVLNFWYMKRKSKETNKQASKQARDQHLIFANKRGVQATDSTTKLWFPTTIRIYVSYSIVMVIKLAWTHLTLRDIKKNKFWSIYECMSSQHIVQINRDTALNWSRITTIKSHTG